MSLNGIYYPHLLSFSDDVPNTYGMVSRLDSYQFDANYDMIKRMGGADAAPCFVGAKSADPELTFTTPSIRTIMSVCTDDYIVRNLQSEDVRMQYRRGKPQSTREALSSAVHFENVLKTSAMLYWLNLSARESEDVTMQGALRVARSSPTVNPWLNVGSTINKTPDCEPIYTLGPVYFNGRLLSSIHEVNWNNNIELYSRKTSANPQDPCYQSIQRFAPVIRCKTNDLLEIAHENPLLTPGLDTYGGQTMSWLRVFLRRRQRTGFFHGVNELQHIELRAYGGWKAGTQTDGDPAEGTLEFHCSRAVDATGKVAGTTLLERFIDVPIPDATAAPALAAISDVTSVSEGSSIFVTPETGGSGVPTSFAETGAPVLPAAGLSIDPISGLIAGDLASGTAGTTINVDITATNGAGNDTEQFDIVVDL